MREIGVSTGIFFKYYGEEEINRCIHHIARWDVDIVEILLTRLFMIDIPISFENKEFLKKKRVRIHAPFYVNKGYDLCKLTSAEIRKVVNLAEEIGAESIILHPDLINNVDSLDDFGFDFTIENVKPELSKDYSLERLPVFLKNIVISSSVWMWAMRSI